MAGDVPTSRLETREFILFGCKADSKSLSFLLGSMLLLHHRELIHLQLCIGSKLIRNKIYSRAFILELYYLIPSVPFISSFHFYNQELCVDIFSKMPRMRLFAYFFIFSFYITLIGYRKYISPTFKGFPSFLFFYLYFFVGNIKNK